MFKSAMGIAFLTAVLGVSGCASKAETIGTVGGAAAGHAISGGGTVGTVAGGVVGYEAGKYYDKKHDNK
jgi:hypothetical protein